MFSRMPKAHAFFKRAVHLYQATHPGISSVKYLLNVDPSPDISDVKVLIFCNKENGLTKLVKLSLQDHGVSVRVHEVKTEVDMIQKAKDVKHDMIICPFLTKRVPKSLLEKQGTPCLIVHPGIVGDRGMSSLDWAIKEKQPSWGVTVLQAAEEMDTGDIWSTSEFQVAEDITKGILYNSQVATAAAEAVVQAVLQYKAKISPQPLDYSKSSVKGSLKPHMKFKDRQIDWALPAEQIVRAIRMSDTQPGCGATLVNLGRKAVLFGGHVQPFDRSPEITGLLEAACPGEVIAQQSGAVLIKAGDGNGVWSTHMKLKRGKQFLKLPATSALSLHMHQIPIVNGPSSWEEITCSHLHGDPRVATVHFDFYNGAMSTDQCKRLRKEIENVAQDSAVRIVILLGGKMFFSNGIHLNAIEAAEDPVHESWLNINAINDVIYSFACLEDKVTISALQSAAGAGGVMMAAAADLFWARKNVLLTPTYKSMALYGSEYWTYFLPQRVGHVVAENLTNSTQSILTQTAESIGLVNNTFGRNTEEFLKLLPTHVQKLFDTQLLDAILERKSQRGPEWAEMLRTHRAFELGHMKKCFQSTDYAEARKAFVYH